TISLVTLLVLSFAVSAMAQDPPAPPAPPPADPIQQLNLSPEQRQQIRRLTEETRQERQTTNVRLRQANAALDQALDADPIDENLIEQRINEVAAAQAAQTRMRAHMELRIRRLLDPEQIATLRRLRLQLRDVIAPQRPNIPNNPRRPNVDAFRPRPRRP
ncbi:MAG TPA: periplasmic heavy metal sensor, partial [Pyrinomonadaceae bacterium]|nr:periplasmic heavy metal sensor [Pyrinomonadaceae bacterium]